MKINILPTFSWIRLLILFTFLLGCVAVVDTDIYLVLVEGEPVAFKQSLLDQDKGKLDPCR